MLSEARAARLAARAGRRRGDGARTVSASRAWGRLVAAGDQGDGNAAAAVWRAWLAGPDDELWQTLVRWRGLETLTEDVFAAVETSAAGDRAAIGAFCTSRGLAPDDRIRQALFHTLTGQAAALRAADPDGSLLAVAYRAADTHTRAGVREALISAHELNLVRAIVSEPVAVATMTPAEREHLTGQLAARRDWPALWHLVQNLPLADAVTSMRLFRDRWQASDDSRAVFGQLARADPDRISSARSALLTPQPLPIHVDGVPGYCAFSLDGRQIGVWHTRSRPNAPYKRKVSLSLFTLPDGSCIRDHVCADRNPLTGVIIGDAIFEPRRREHDYVPRNVLVRRDSTRTKVLGQMRSGERIMPYLTGFMLAETHAPTDTTLRFYDSRGRLVHAVDLSRDLENRWNRHFLAADPVSGRLAARWDQQDAGSRLQIYDRYGASQVAISAPGAVSFRRYVDACFCGEDAVITTEYTDQDDGEARLWRVTGDQLALQGTVRCPGGGHPVAIPARGVIAVVSWRVEQGIGYLDAKTLAQINPPGELAHITPSSLWSSPDRRSLAWTAYPSQRVDVLFDAYAAAAAPVADRPVAAMTPADLHTVSSALSGTDPAAATRPFLELLQACLRHRFASEVAIGGTGLAAAGHADIALSTPADE